MLDRDFNNLALNEGSTIRKQEAVKEENSPREDVRTRLINPIQRENKEDNESNGKRTGSSVIVKKR